MAGIIRRREPWSLLTQLHGEMDRLFDNHLKDMSGELANVSTSDWVPAVDVKEESDKYVIHADIPGVNPKDIHVTMDNGVLTIEGERKHEASESEKGYKRIERVSGSFLRRFSLPDSVNADAISAKGNNGVLEIIIPKANKRESKKITVEG